jgi:Transposase IS116/IS110/IS902 family
MSAPVASKIRKPSSPSMATSGSVDHQLVDERVGDCLDSALAVAGVPGRQHGLDDVATAEPLLEGGIHRHSEVGGDHAVDHLPSHRQTPRPRRGQNRLQVCPARQSAMYVLVLRKRLQLAAWAGLTPTVRGSDLKVRRGYISKPGSSWLRWVMNQAPQTAKRPPKFAASYGSIPQQHQHRRGASD